jgi:hypothetical protein
MGHCSYHFRQCRRNFRLHFPARVRFQGRKRFLVQRALCAGGVQRAEE